MRPSLSIRRFYWLAIASSLSAFVLSSGCSQSDHGAEVFDYCTQCHGSDAQGKQLFDAPALAGMDRAYIEKQLRKFRSGQRAGEVRRVDVKLQNTDGKAWLRQWIREAGFADDIDKNGFVNLVDTHGLRMRPIAAWLSDDDIKAVARHISELPVVKPALSLPVTSASVERGRKLFASCTTCHGRLAQGCPNTENDASCTFPGLGGEPLRTPALVNLDDWYLVRQLNKFRTGLRGGNPASPPKDQNARQMYTFANSLPDQQAIRDVVAYITSLGAKR